MWIGKDPMLIQWIAKTLIRLCGFASGFVFSFDADAITYILHACSALFCHHSRLSLSRLRLSRITTYLEVKIWSLYWHGNLTTGYKILWKRGEIALLRSNFASFPLHFQYISNFRSQIPYSFVKCGCSIYFFSSLQIRYVTIWISRIILQSTMDFEITRVDCICSWPLLLVQAHYENTAIQT